MIRIDIDDREVKQALQTLQRRLGDLRPVMEDIGVSIRARPWGRAIDTRSRQRGGKQAFQSAPGLGAGRSSLVVDSRAA